MVNTVKSSAFLLGQTARAMDLLGSAGVLPTHVQQVIDDPIRRAVVADAYMGIIAPQQVEFNDLLAREISVTGSFCKIAKIAYPGDERIEKALHNKEAAAGISIYDRFIPGGLKRRQLLDVSRNFGIKLYKNDPRDADNDGEEMPTEQGVFQLDYMSMMEPTDDLHRPFMLDYDAQWTWATEQGGNGFSTAEQALYAIIRAKLELGRIPFMGGSFRCKNAYGSDYSLGVSFDAGVGLYVFSRWGRSRQRWSLGALPWKYWGL